MIIVNCKGVLECAQENLGLVNFIFQQICCGSNGLAMHTFLPMQSIVFHFHRCEL